MRGPKIASIVSGAAALAFLFCIASGVNAAPPHGGGGGAPHAGGGGAPHFGGGGGAAHIGGGGGAPHIGGGAPHFGGGAPHMGGGAPHIGGVPHFARHAGGIPHVRGVPHFGRHIGGVPRFAAHGQGGRRIGGVSHGGPHMRIGHLARPGGRGVHPPTRTTRLHPTAPGVSPTAHLRTGVPRVTGRTTPGSFADHRHLAGIGALRPFFGHHWHRHGHLGWVGPWFWPYAYGDVFYYALWPYEYASYDPFWYYGYDDLYEGIFSPYDYQPYVAGSGAPARMTALTHTVAQSCTDEAAEVTGWPIDQIQAAVGPDQQQTALLDALGNAVVKASDVIKAHCPTAIAFTPPDRLAQMQERLEGLVTAVNIVQPPLAKFYDSLSDEQKARFNEIGAQAKPTGQQRQAQQPKSECGENVLSFPTDRIEQDLHPNAAQRARLDALADASAKAADLIGASCPSELPVTPPDRLAAEGKHLQAMLAAVRTIRPPLDAFYASLSDEQKGRFNTLGRQLFAQK